MSLNNMIPTVWAAALLQNLDNVHVYSQPGVINRDYEGDIKQKGDSVKITSIGRVTIDDYERDTDINSPQAIQDAAQMLAITEAKYFNFAVDDIDAAQQVPKVMNGAMQQASWGLNDVADLFLGGKWTEIAPGNFIGTDGAPTEITTANAYDSLVDLGTLLDDNNVPTQGRWAIVPPWFHGVLLKDPNFIHATALGDQILRNGQIGQAAGFDIMKSNNVANVGGAQYKLMAGHAIAWTYAEQIVKVEGYTPEKRFADAVKGLHVYGAKVTRPDALACLVANKG